MSKIFQSRECCSSVINRQTVEGATFPTFLSYIFRAVTSHKKQVKIFHFYSKWPRHRKIQIFLARLDTKARNVNSSRNARTGQLLWSQSMFLTGMVTRYFALIFFILGQCSPGFPATNEAGISETSSLEENLQLSGINDCRQKQSIEDSQFSVKCRLELCENGLK